MDFKQPGLKKSMSTKNLTEQLEAFFDKIDLKVNKTDIKINTNHSVYTCKLEYLGFSFESSIHAFSNTRTLLVIAHLPFMIEKKVSKIIKLLTQINFGMIHGSFEYNFSNGSIQYKTSSKIFDFSQLPIIFNFLLQESGQTLQKYSEGIKIAAHTSTKNNVIIEEIESFSA